MANAGGDVDIAPGSILTFADGRRRADRRRGDRHRRLFPRRGLRLGQHLADPGSPDAPPTPHQTALAAFAGQPIRGIWKLWAFDDASADSGQITSATLTIENEIFPNPTLDPTPATSTQPFIHVEGVATGARQSASCGLARHQWHRRDVLRCGRVRSSIPGTQQVRGRHSAEEGRQHHHVSARQHQEPIAHDVLHRRPSNEFTYSFAEGAIGTFFDTDITLANPAGADAPLKIDFLPESGGTLTLNTTVAAQSPLQVSVDNVVANGSPSTVVHSTDARAARGRAHDDLGRHRLRRSRRHVGRAGDALAVRRRVAGVLRHLRAAGERQHDADRRHGAVPARERRRGERRHHHCRRNRATRCTRATSLALRGQSFGIDITSVQPIIAERAMYLPGARLFEGGHESAGVNAAEHAVVPRGGRDRLVLRVLRAPEQSEFVAGERDVDLSASGWHDDPAERRPAGQQPADDQRRARRRHAPRGRRCVDDGDVRHRDRRRARDVLAGLSIGWREAHNSFGVTQSALRWGIADGRIGTARGLSDVTSCWRIRIRGRRRSRCAS